MHDTLTGYVRLMTAIFEHATDKCCHNYERKLAQFHVGKCGIGNTNLASERCQANEFEYLVSRNRNGDATICKRDTEIRKYRLFELDNTCLQKHVKALMTINMEKHQITTNSIVTKQNHDKAVLDAVGPICPRINITSATKSL